MSDPTIMTIVDAPALRTGSLGTIAFLDAYRACIERHMNGGGKPVYHSTYTTPGDTISIPYCRREAKWLR